ncbi:unnamed protein product [Adineta steineri]|uniref:protein-ribulosamine 3-kinase n=1 Tax=Adineta steineri TaxID=433720 RepID=A0A819MCR9_9BILA|nr:unnamed protein product [Adineta steineri]CAF3977833.1 unnamed protein product [Adineta steineri]
MDTDIGNHSEESSSQLCAMQIDLQNDSTGNDISSSKKLTKDTGPFSVQDLSHFLKTSSSLRTQIFSSSNITHQDDNEDEFVIKSISNGYVSHAFTFKVNNKFIDKNSRNEYFIKVNKNKHAKHMFDAEAIGLHALQEAYGDLVRVPLSFASGYLSQFDDNQGGWFLAEFVKMKKIRTKDSNLRNCQFAQVLAKMHQISAETHSRSLHSGQYGFHTNNFYIHTEQDNTWQNDWSHFFIEQRFKPIIQRMKTDPHLIDDHGKNMELILLCERLIPHIPSFLASSNQVQLRPCLLHGDLSSQNWSLDKQDRIVIFDGSPFYGPFEVDIFTMPEVFISAYFDAIGGPVEGYEIRFEVYNLLRLLRSIIDAGLDTWRPLIFQSLTKLLTHCGAWTLPLFRFPCGVKIPVDKIKLPSSTNSTIQKKNVVLLYGGGFCPIHLNHLAVMDFVADTLEKSPYEFEIIGGYFCPSSQNWIEKKLPGNYLPNAYREALLMLSTEGTRWMVDRNYSLVNTHAKNIIKAIQSSYGTDFEITVVHICGIDAIHYNGDKVSTQYPLVIVDRLEFNGETLWKEYIQTATTKNRERLIWISPWKGETRSSTMIRNLLTNLNDNNHIETSQSLQNLLAPSCIDYILEYKLQKWFQSHKVL